MDKICSYRYVVAHITHNGYTPAEQTIIFISIIGGLVLCCVYCAPPESTNCDNNDYTDGFTEGIIISNMMSADDTWYPNDSASGWN